MEPWPVFTSESEKGSETAALMMRELVTTKVLIAAVERLNLPLMVDDPLPLLRVVKGGKRLNVPAPVVMVAPSMTMGPTSSKLPFRSSRPELVMTRSEERRLGK